MRLYHSVVVVMNDFPFVLGLRSHVGCSLSFPLELLMIMVDSPGSLSESCFVVTMNDEAGGGGHTRFALKARSIYCRCCRIFLVPVDSQHRVLLKVLAYHYEVSIG